MTQIIDPSVGTTLKDQFSLARAKKAYTAGVAGAIAGFGSISIAGIFADGKIDGPEVGGIIASVGGGFVLAFFGAWFPYQAVVAPAPGVNDALVKGDGLGGPDHSAR